MLPYRPLAGNANSQRWVTTQRATPNPRRHGRQSPHPKHVVLVGLTVVVWCDLLLSGGLGCRAHRRACLGHDSPTVMPRLLETNGKPARLTYLLFAGPRLVEGLATIKFPLEFEHGTRRNGIEGISFGRSGLSQVSTYGGSACGRAPRLCCRASDLPNPLPSSPHPDARLRIRRCRRDHEKCCYDKCNEVLHGTSKIGHSLL
jgi:hypothetical protein